ncbi:pyrimidine 5-nucleotidase [Exidia glandulosa HHB12029]|uniref:Pyrimidine 5-nucleotidase n=1 Tax=Exidia glandulosa HHB12029 TaxID=1314781 RepID=A0A165QL22_EXIGL|nr:pyrimidine 5-nucleotidase [Exidia glandulosa HHB12029]
MVWLDIDNTLYPASTRIAEAMTQRIHAFFVSLGLPDDEAHKLHMHYYKEYGLALRGLTRHHDIGTHHGLEFDKACDQTLPLEQALAADPAVRKLLQDIDRSKARVWALTNAYITHASRVLDILNLRDQIEEIIYCDYSNPTFSCKPEPEFFTEAMKKAGVTDNSRCLFIDDSLPNCRAAKKLGWHHVVWFCEDGRAGAHMHAAPMENPKAAEGVDAVISSLEELRDVWSFIFTDKS